MPDINEPTEAEIEAVKADQLWWQQVEEPLGLRLGGWTFRKRAQFFDISTGATIELPGSVAERVIAARRVSSAPSFADGIEVAAKRIEAEGAKYLPGGLMDMKRICHDLASDVRALANNPQASSGGGRLNDQGHSYRLSTDALDVLMAHGLLAKVGGAYRLATRDELLADPGSAGVNCNSPEAVLAVVRAVLTSSEPPQLSHTDPLRSGAAEGNEAEAAAPKPDPAIAELERRCAEVNMLAFKWMEAHDKLKAGKPYSLPKPADLPDAIAALTASNDRVAELERERDDRAGAAALNLAVLKQWRSRAEAAEAEVSRLKAGAVTDGWRPIESAPKDGRSIAVWLPATATEQPHAFAPVSICEDGTWWDDSTGGQIEPLAATYWKPIQPPNALTNIEKERDDG